MNKVEFREQCLNKLRTIHHSNRYSNEIKLLRQLENLIEKIDAKEILFYWPMHSEVNVKPLIKKMRKKHSLYLPFMQDVSFKMVTFRLPLLRKKFGIYEAGNSNKKINKIDVVIVPIVGVDGDRRRVGFGKGMYDRFFENLPYSPIKIFIQPQLCYTNKKICDDYDIQADYLLTPQGCYTTQRIQYDKRTAFKRVYCNNRSGNRLCCRFSHRKKNCRVTT